MERFFFLDDADKRLVGRRRNDHLRLGFAVQLVTVRYLGTFLADPLDVPTAVIEFLAEQLEIADPSCVEGLHRTPDEPLPAHVGDPHRARSAGVRRGRSGLEAWMDARAWTTGDGPKTIFDAAVAWLRERRVLLPGVTTLARLVARVRDAATQRLWDTLAALLTPDQRRLLELLLEIPEGGGSPIWTDCVTGR